jgi:type IV fimbrial biogenesis protein FimT
MLMRKTSMKPIKGFTLIEMMIAVAIMALLLGLGVPSFQTFIRNAQIRTAAESMQAGLHLARSEALRRNARVSLWLVNGLTAACARSNTGTSWVVSVDNPAGLCVTASSDTVAPRLIQSRAGNDGSGSVNVTATISSGSATGSSCITFNGFGRVEAACTGGGAPIGAIDFSSANATTSTKNLSVRILSGGAIRMCNPAASTTDLAAC